MPVCFVFVKKNKLIVIEFGGNNTLLIKVIVGENDLEGLKI
jgi:hypothetical protein